MRFDYDFDAAIFDMDGTLLDTMRYWRFTTLEYLLTHGLPVKNEDLVRMLDTSSRKLLYDIAAREGFDMPDKATVITELEDYMGRHYQYDSHPKDGSVHAFLQKLKDRGIRLCVATGSRREHARVGLERAGFLNFFEFVTDNYEAANGITKAEPEYFVQTAARLGVAPERCVVFEDACYAMEAAKKAGCRVLAIEDQTARNQKEKIQEIADWYIKSYSELL